MKYKLRKYILAVDSCSLSLVDKEFAAQASMPINSVNDLDLGVADGFSKKSEKHAQEIAFKLLKKQIKQEIFELEYISKQIDKQIESKDLFD